MGCVCSSSDSPKEAQKHVGIKETNEEKNADVQKQKKDNVGSGETHKREVNASNLIGETEIHEEEGDLSTKVTITTKIKKLLLLLSPLF